MEASLGLENSSPVSKTSASAVDLEKDDVVGWRGGLPVDLARVDKYGITLEERLTKHVKDELDREVSNQTKLVSNIRRWQRQYKGKKKGKTSPWPGCANVAIPLTRINIDTVFTRIIDGIFNRRRPVIVKAKKPEYLELARQVEEALDWLLTNVIEFRKKIIHPLLQQLKIGTGVLYLTWETKNRTVYRYATPAEEADPKVKKWRTSGGAKIVKEVQTIYDGPNIYPVPREDFVISSDAVEIEDAYLVGFRKRYRRHEIDQNVKRKMWRSEGADKIFSPDKFTENEETRAENQGKELDKTDFSAPYELWTVWLKYDVDGDGEPDDIMLTVHRETGAILRAIYTPTFTGRRPFVKLVGYPSEYAFDGEGYCEILYSIQEEVDALHNQRLDRGTLINSFMTITRSGSGLENFKIVPGKNYVSEDNIQESFREVKFSDQYPSTFTEEANLMNLADKATGNTPALQGISLAERPVFKDTQALLSETNKKFKMMIDNIISGITESIYQTLELFSQYEPQISYKVVRADGTMEDRSLTLPIMQIRDGFNITLAASSDVMSQEARRELNQNLYFMTSDYLTKQASVAQALTSPQVPVEFKKYLLAAASASAKLFRDILLDSDRPDATELSVDLSQVMDLNTVLAPPAPPPQMMPPPQQQSPMRSPLMPPPGGDNEGAMMGGGVQA